MSSTLASSSREGTESPASAPWILDLHVESASIAEDRRQAEKKLLKLLLKRTLKSAAGSLALPALLFFLPFRDDVALDSRSRVLSLSV